MKELKPCPFCGRKSELSEFAIDSNGFTRLRINCPCGADIEFNSDDPVYDSRGFAHQLGLSAIEKYNNRVIDEDAISRCELFNRLATIPAPPEANDFKAEIYKVIQSMEAK